ncbi:hypothetical protein Tco_0129458 [Tanacetum coccineum]
MPTEMELTLEQTQQGVSYEVSVLSDIEDSHGPSDAMHKPLPATQSQKDFVSKLTEIHSFLLTFSLRVFTMKMEILLEPTSNKLMVEHAEYDESNTYVLERFNTTAGNPVKKILLKLNLSDHRLFKDGGGGIQCPNNKFKEQASIQKSMITTTYSRREKSKGRAKDQKTKQSDLDNSTSNVLIPLDSWTSGLLVYKLPLSGLNVLGGGNDGSNVVVWDKVVMGQNVEKVRALGANGVAKGSTLGVWFEVGSGMVVEEALEQALCLFEFRGFSSFNGKCDEEEVEGVGVGRRGLLPLDLNQALRNKVDHREEEDIEVGVRITMS